MIDAEIRGRFVLSTRRGIVLLIPNALTLVGRVTDPVRDTIELSRHAPVLLEDGIGGVKKVGRGFHLRRVIMIDLLLKLHYHKAVVR